jgi:hypothetical protein
MGFIPSLRTISIALKFLSGCLMIPGEDKPLPYVNYNVIDFFYCALIGLKPKPLYETTHGWNSEKIERRTSNIQHRTLNIDDATLYRF